jgi:hypothetical protein
MSNYKDLLKVSPHQNAGSWTYKVKVKAYGYLVHRMSNYVTLWTYRIEVNIDESAKAKVTEATNYRQTVTYSLYFNKEGNEITRKEYQRHIKTLKQL